MSPTTHQPRIDEIERPSDDAVTAYTFFPPAEAAMRALAQELFGTRWRPVVVGPCIEAVASQALPAVAEAPAVRD